MSLSEVRIIDAETWLRGFRVGGVHVLSDRTLACIVTTVNGSNWDVAIYTSIDAGLTWSSALSIYTNQDSSGFFSNWVGDTLYGVYAPNVTNESALFYQADYTAATASWALTKSAKVIQTETTGGSISHGMVDKEYGGTRLWAGLYHFTSGNPYTVAKYSDDGGDTWTAAYSVANQTDYFVFLYALEFNVVLTSAGYYGPTAGVWETHHKYTDAAGTWSAYSQVIPLTYAANVYHQHAAAKAAATPPKYVWLAGVDLAAATKHAHFGWVVEDGSGVVTHGTQVDSFNTAAGETYGIGVTAYTDGAQFFYVYSGTLSTMRRRNFNTGASWGSESTWTLSTALGGANWFSVAISLDSVMDHKHLILSAVGATTTRRLWMLFENIVETLDVDAVIPHACDVPKVFFPVVIAHDLRASSTFDGALAHELLGTVLLDTDIASVASMESWVENVFKVPHLLRAVSNFDSDIPHQGQRGLISLVVDAIISQELRSQVQFDTSIAHQCKRFSEWSLETALGDTWTKDGAIVDSWAKDGALADSWSKE